MNHRSGRILITANSIEIPMKGNCICTVLFYRWDSAVWRVTLPVLKWTVKENVLFFMISEMVGLLGSEIKEARERIRVAFKNMEFQLPPVKITVNISPASLRKDGTFYDLPVAAGILTAQGVIPQEYAQNVMIAGELGLNGEVRPVRGVLPMVLEARKQGIGRCIIPSGNLNETELIDGIEIVGIDRLEELTELLCNCT